MSIAKKGQWWHKNNAMLAFIEYGNMKQAQHRAATDRSRPEFVFPPQNYQNCCIPLRRNVCWQKTHTKTVGNMP